MSELKLSFWERHKTKILAIVTIALVVGTIGIVFLVISLQQQKTTLVVFHAGSLTVPFEAYASMWTTMHPNIVISNQPYGSADAIRQITELNKPGDILGSADYKLIITMMMNKPIPDMPGYNYSSWYIIFARNEIIIAYNKALNPPWLDNLTSGKTPWYAILNRTDVTFGRSDPYQDPCGYYTLMVWGLADRFYNKTPNSQVINESLFAKDPLAGYTAKGTPIGGYSGSGATKVKAKEVDMDALLDSGEIDYLFIYRSVAIQHNYGYIRLDQHINLGNFTYESFYNKVKVHRISPLLPGKADTDKKAATIQYGLTIPNNAPHPAEAIDYVKFILGYPGKLLELGQPAYYPAYASNVSKLPAALQPYCVNYPYS